MNIKLPDRAILIITILLTFALACDLAGGGAAGDTPATPDALATVLADIASATENATANGDALPTNTQAAEEDEPTSPTATQETVTPESTSTETHTEIPAITNTPSGYPTAIPLPNPQASNFYTCLTNCASDGSNHQTSFPEKTEVIYFQFEFTEFPVKAPYSRAWYKDGVEWVRYDCYWPGPEAGVEEITLTDPLGLPSGNWNLVITINGVQVLNKTLTIQGSWSQWTPPGHFTSCYGKR